MKDVIIYTTRYCPFCIRAKYLLDNKNVSYTEISVDGKPELRAEMTAKAGRHTVPQIWVGGHHVGGCDELMAIERSGELDRLLA
ncbi:glutaredoxin 3 [Microbulbifer sp. SH-1]|uniref:glutaredoxin 3 n=1 Tax=Microbulbifer sp. SH-1 TaxID=2681547 RepID=UPI001407F6E4|nr:glutaredoxin 3 [Microbulbifer sp. SH-1]QIL90970.1 glutaredoxin 3 [Microbulbifer sp. SH-1]